MHMVYIIPSFQCKTSALHVKQIIRYIDNVEGVGERYLYIPILYCHQGPTPPSFPDIPISPHTHTLIICIFFFTNQTLIHELKLNN